MDLYTHGDWSQLVAVARLWSLRDPTARELPQLLLAAAYARTGRPEEAERIWSELQTGPHRPWVLLHRAAAVADSDAWLAVAWLDRIEVGLGEGESWRQGFEARTRLRIGDLEGARRCLDGGIFADSLPSRVRSRRPAVGALASALVPGLGQAIAGQPVEAASAFGVVGLLAAGTGWALTSERPGTAGVVGAVGLLFWAGNVYGGGEAALRFNRARLGEVELSLDRADLPGTTPPPLPPLR